jgi:hypothetical protein
MKDNGRDREMNTDSTTIRQIEFELEKAEHGLALPYDAERVGQCARFGAKGERELDHAHHPPQGIGEAGRGTANPAYESTGAVGGDCWPSISSPGFSVLPR